VSHRGHSHNGFYVARHIRRLDPRESVAGGDSHISLVAPGTEANVPFA
jgi:hypothetical protein